MTVEDNPAPTAPAAPARKQVGKYLIPADWEIVTSEEAETIAIVGHPRPAKTLDESEDAQ